jgi:hypothetical protein
MTCVCHEIRAGRFGETAVACTCEETVQLAELDFAVEVATVLDEAQEFLATRGVNLAQDHDHEGGEMSGKSFIEAPEQYHVLSPAESPSRFGQRPKSPALAKAWDAQVAAERERQEEEAAIIEEARSRLAREQAEAKHERRVQEVMRRLGGTAA